MNSAIEKKPGSSTDNEGDDKLGHFSSKSKREFFTRVWPGTDPRDEDDPLLKNYYRCCNYGFLSPVADAVARQTNSNVATIVEAIMANKTRDNVLQLATESVHRGHVSSHCQAEDASVAKQLLTIALKTALMCNIRVGALEPGETELDQKQISWSEGDVATLLQRAFPKETKLDGKGLLPRTFHARNLERLGSIQILWTHNLLDHLRLQDPAKEGAPFRVSVFHHARFLRQHEHSGIFPEGFVRETLWTMALLFPGHVGGTTRWFRTQRRKNGGDLDITACYCDDVLDHDHRAIQNFEFWRDRLTILKQAYDEAEPATIFQWWNDGRKRERWATFWVAMLVLVLTVFFGTVQCIEGGIQVYKAYHPSDNA